MLSSHPPAAAGIMHRRDFYFGVEQRKRELREQFGDAVPVILLPNEQQFVNEHGAITRVTVDRGALLLQRGTHRIATPEEVVAGRALESAASNTEEVSRA